MHGLAAVAMHINSQRQSYGKQSEYLAHSGYCSDVLEKVSYIS